MLKNFSCKDNIFGRVKMQETLPNQSNVAYDGLFSAIVPCYNERDAIPIFYAEFLRVIDLMGNPDFELIFVDDGSTDTTLEYLQELSALDTRVKCISFSRNFGKEAAMYAGLESAKGDYVAIMDADLQDPPSLLPEMFEAIKSGYDSVATRRRNRDGECPIRSFGARLFYKVLNKISKLKFTEGARDFRLMKRRMVEAILAMPEYNKFLKGMYEWVGFNTKWIEYDNVERSTGSTKWSTWGLFIYSLDALTSFSKIPLVLVSALGVGFCMLSVVAIILLSIRQLIWHNSAFGWTSMVCIMFFLSGIQLFCLGILGNYISKIFTETKKRPYYIVKSKTNI